MKKRYIRDILATGLFFSVCSHGLATTVTWDGGPDGLGTSWNDPANWSKDVVPGSGDTVVFTDAGLSAGKVIELGADQTVLNVLIQTATAFTLGSDDDRTNAVPRLLTLTDLERQDVSGTEGVHVIAAPVAVAPDASGNSTWSVSGSNVLRINASLGAAVTPVSFVKRGAGTLNLNYASPTFDGTWAVEEGEITATVGSSMKGNATVGGAEAAASLRQTVKNAFYNGMVVTVLTNGTFTSVDSDTGRIGALFVKEGGSATIGSYFYAYKAYLTGGTLNGGRMYNGGYGQTLTSYASEREALFNCGFGLSKYYDFEIAVADGAAPVDLRVTKAVYSDANSKTVKKTGAGVCCLTAANTFKYGVFTVIAGTLLADNTTGSANGNTPLAVNAGTTLGGTGFIGGVSGYGNADLSVAGTAASAAVVAPGTIDAGTGAHVIGTLTVGDLVVQTNNVTFGAYSTLALTLNTSGQHDRLAVNGTLSLATTSDSLQLSLTGEGDLPAGTYPLVTFQQLADAGQVFDTVSGLPERGELVYTSSGVDLVVSSSAPKGTVFTIN